jgi:glycosyltransferase involved in cell wall biosynthesis
MTISMHPIGISSSEIDSSSHRKILFVLGTLWGENGITSHLLTLSKGLQKLGWEIAIASSLASNSDAAISEARRAVERFTAHGIQHFEIRFSPLKPSPSNIINAIQSFKSLNRVLEEFRPDIIHLHSLSIAPYVRLVAIQNQIPMIATSHLEPDSQKVAPFWRIQINRYMSELWGDRLIAISREIQQFFEVSLQVNPKRVKLVYHGVDETHFRPPSLEERRSARLQYSLQDDDRVLCLIGRLDPIKGHDVLIEALSILQRQNFKVTALIAGKSYGDEQARVMQQAQAAQVSESIHCLGMVDSRQVLWASDMIILPSRREGFPLVILEGMLCGIIPIRTPAAGVFDQIEDGVNGWIIPFDDAEALATRIRETFENIELKIKLSTQALRFSQERFTLEHMMLQTVSVYDEVLVKKRVK